MNRKKTFTYYHINKLSSLFLIKNVFHKIVLAFQAWLYMYLLLTNISIGHFICFQGILLIILKKTLLSLSKLITKLLKWSFTGFPNIFLLQNTVENILFILVLTLQFMPLFFVGLFVHRWSHFTNRAVLWNITPLLLLTDMYGLRILVLIFSNLH